MSFHEMMGVSALSAPLRTRAGPSERVAER